MSKIKALFSDDKAKNWVLLAIPILFIIGTPVHFIYEWSGKLAAVGIFAPVNESVWEHLKLSFWPMLIWWTAGYFILKKKTEISSSRWFVSCLIAILTCPMVIICFYYTYTGALGIESLLLDIFSLLLAITLSQLLAFHVYRYTRLKDYWLYISVAVLIIMVIIFTAFTFNAPHLPLFKNSLTGNYGI